MKITNLFAALWLALPTGAIAQYQQWDFSVLLDGDPIGTHRFSLESTGQEARSLVSQAEFRVRLLGVPVYRYRHRAQESWQGNCLRSLDAETDDDGQRSRVQLRAQSGGGLQLHSAQGSAQLSGCLMSFAYWNPALRSQARLLNAQDGRIEQVTWQRLESAAIEAQGRTVVATRWRVSGTERPLDVWWTEDGRWLGLDATVRGERRLSYRLR